MANPYYTISTTFIPGTRARSDEVNAEYLALQTAFDMLPGGTGDELYTGRATYAGSTGGSVNAYTASPTDSRASDTDGDEIVFKIHVTNTGASTLNVDGNGARSIVRADGAAVAAGDLVIGQIYAARYDSANARWQLITVTDSYLDDAAASAASAASSASSAGSSASAAASSASSASTSETNAANSESLANEWAEQAEDVAVTGHPGEYSAYHWAQKAQGFSGLPSGTAAGDILIWDGASNWVTSTDINVDAGVGVSVSVPLSAASFTATVLATLASVDINGGAIDGATIGGATPAPGVFTTLQSTGLATLASVDIDGGAIDGTAIGGSTPGAGVFTTLQSTGLATLASVDIDGGAIDGTAIGASSASSGVFTTLNSSGATALASGGGMASVGAEDSAQGTLAIYGDGPASNIGGLLQIFAAADHDASIDFTQLWMFQDDFYITSGGVNRYSIQGSNGDHYWYTNAGAVAMYLDVSTEDLNVDGGVIAGGDSSFSNGNVKTVEFGTAFVLQNSVDENVITGTINAQTTLYYNNVAEFQTQDSDANYATSGAQVNDHGGTLRDVGFNVMPVYELDTSTTLSETHVGGLVHSDAGASVTFTLASGTSGAVPPVGAVIIITNEDATNDKTISAAGTLRWFNGDGAAPATGNRTLAGGGVATCYKYASTEWHIWGTGIS